jgi:hypothetical protein
LVAVEFSKVFFFYFPLAISSATMLISYSIEFRLVADQK